MNPFEIPVGDKQLPHPNADMEDLIGGIAVQFDENYRAGVRVGIVVDAFDDGSVAVVTKDGYTHWNKDTFQWAVNAGTLPDMMEDDPHWLEIFEDCRNLPA